MWDVFPSHASEDKQVVADSLVKLLEARGVSVWYDKTALRLGDSLRDKIDEGLSKSRFGIVILSKQFFAKQWPKNELGALFAREVGGQPVILPVWHEITKEEILDFSPLIADRKATMTANGLDLVADEILQVVRPLGNTPLVATLASSPRLVRPEGLTERVGDIAIVISRSGNLPPTVLSVSLTLSRNITNRLAEDDVTDAVLQYASHPTLLVRGCRSSDNTLVRDVRIAVAGTATSGGKIFAFVEITTDNGIPVTQESRVVEAAMVAELMRTRVAPQISELSSDATALLTFTEGFDHSWTTKAEETGILPRPDNGTRFRAAFNNIPAGVTLLVSKANVATNAASPKAVLAFDYVEAAVPGMVVVPTSGGSGTVMWEWCGARTERRESLTFMIVVATMPGSASNGSITVNLSLAPVGGGSTMSSSSWVPRFADTSTATILCTIS